MKIRNIIGALVLTLVALTSCNDAKYDTISDRVYLAESGLESYKMNKTMVDDKGGQFTITPRVSQPASEAIKIDIDLSKQVLDNYNDRTGLDYTILPSEFVEFESVETTIKTGEVLSPTIKVVIKPLSQELLDAGKKYAVPVLISSTNCNYETLTGADALIVALDQVIVTSVPIINSRNNIKMNMRKDYELNEWSLEFRVHMSKLGTGIGQLNNQAMFAAFAPDGKSGNIYTRFGDAPIKGNLLQIKHQGTQFNSNHEFQANTWYHIAFVHDGKKVMLYINGKLDSYIDSPGEVTNLSKDKFSFGNHDYLKANAMLSELRFWTTNITESQIQNNMFITDPTSEGLEAYWKLNEGKGNNFKDATGHGNDAVADGNTQWIDGIRSDE